jgi:hypothetical protein
VKKNNGDKLFVAEKGSIVPTAIDATGGVAVKAALSRDSPGRTL